MEKKSYLAEASADAYDMVDHYVDDIALQILDSGNASDDLFNDYPNGDSYHHEHHVDKWYDLREAVDVIEELDAYEETDKGLWEGKDMKEALGACAAYTYGNAVYHFWREMIELINNEVTEFKLDYDDEGVITKDCEKRLKEFIMLTAARLKE